MTIVKVLITISIVNAYHFIFMHIPAELKDRLREIASAKRLAVLEVHFDQMSTEITNCIVPSSKASMLFYNAS